MAAMPPDPQGDRDTLKVPQMEIGCEFNFDAVHFFDHKPVGHMYRQVHGHSFVAEVVLSGEPDPATGFIADFVDLEIAVSKLRGELDHKLLNEIPGLQAPSLENLSMWIWRKIAIDCDNLTRVLVRRPSCKQACTYYGPVHECSTAIVREMASVS